MQESTDRFDPNVLMLLTNGNKAVISEVVEMFQAQCPLHLDGLEIAATECNLTTALFRAHAIKGMATQLGAPALRKLAEDMEKLAREGAESATLLAVCAAIRQEYDELCLLLKTRG